jgi:hypothetical protein
VRQNDELTSIPLSFEKRSGHVLRPTALLEVKQRIFAKGRLFISHRAPRLQWLRKPISPKAVVVSD